MRLNPEQRSLIGKMVDRLGNKSLVAKAFGVTRNTIYRWNKRRKHTKDRKRRKKRSKVTLNVELSILAMRNFFEWGTERIQKGMYSLPKFMCDELRRLKVPIVQHVSLSRPVINDVLKKHKINGYKHKKEGWKFFRAKKPNELWQLDIKGPFKVQGKKYWFVICIDDFSRYAVLAEQCSHAPTIKEIGKILKPLIKKHHPKKILTDNNPFKEEWDEWCKSNNVEPIHAHPYYPQDKGKVERAIRNFAEEFVYLLKKFPQWLHGKIKEYQRWHNNKRINRGINAIPCQLFT
jgi:transposase InsO family protein